MRGYRCLLINLRNFGKVVGVFLLVCLIGCVLMGVAIVLRQKGRFERDKLIRFECGFDPIRRRRIPFSLRFFLLALLFLVFDLEIILLFPLIFSVSKCNLSLAILRKTWVIVFLLVLVGGLVHEINEGTLDWAQDR